MQNPFFEFVIDSIQIIKPRAGGFDMSGDTDFVTLTVKVGSGEPYTQKLAMAPHNLPAGTYHVGLSTGPIFIPPTEPVVINYLIVNAGNALPQDVLDYMASAGGAVVGGVVGSVVPVLGTIAGSILGSVVGYVVGQLGDLLTANCDGLVAAEVEAFTSSDLLGKTSTGPYYHSTTHNGTDSPAGCGDNSVYVVNWRIVRDNVQTFQAIDTANVFVLGSDHNLWLEKAPFGTVPQPQRVMIGSGVQTFQALNTQLVYELGTVPWETNSRVLYNWNGAIDRNVQAFQALDEANVFVLGTDGNLWYEWAPFASDSNLVPINRKQVDGNVYAFQAIDTNTVYVLGTDGNLWLENGPFGTVPLPHGTGPSQRIQVDANVRAFQANKVGPVFVLGTDGKLWAENYPFGTVPLPTGTGPGQRILIDANVAGFQGEALYALGVFVLGTDGKLWLEKWPFGSLPPQNRTALDANVRAFQAIDLAHVVVLGSDGKLWLEQAPFGTVPLPTGAGPGQRIEIDANVA